MRDLDPKFEAKLRELAAQVTWAGEGYDGGYANGQTELAREILLALEQN